MSLRKSLKAVSRKKFIRLFKTKIAKNTPIDYKPKKTASIFHYKYIKNESERGEQLSIE